jgi:hypothetical protein
LPTFALAREDENRVAFGDMFAAIHCLLRSEHKRLRPRIADRSFDRKRHDLLFYGFRGRSAFGAEKESDIQQIVGGELGAFLDELEAQFGLVAH